MAPTFWQPGYSRYSYQVTVNDIESKLVTAEWLNATARNQYDLHGINLLFQQSGGVREWDW
jgi:hypothetical protein